WSELEGLQVKTMQGQLLGQVDHLRETGSNDILVVVACEGSLDQRERWIPWIPDEVVKQVDIAGGLILVDWDADF
ncbi:MAG TPA: PRC-barrel domain-containing protein, partial [Pseudomonadales bacterium]|nr:PRC-barrel domain-containing protein [Pseudomonadales bacterium]